MFKSKIMKKYKNLSKFMKYYKKQKKLIYFLIFVMLLASSLGMALPYFYSKRLIGVTDNSFNQVVLYSLLIIIIVTFHHLFWYLWEKLASILTNRVSIDIRKDLTEKLMNTSYQIIKHKTSGYYLERFTDDVDEVSSFLSNFLGTLVDTLTNFSFLILIFFLNYICGVLFSIGIIVLYIFDLIKIKKNLIYSEKVKTLNEEFNSKINENIKGIKDIKGLGIKEQVITSTQEVSQILSDTKIKQDRIIALLSRIKTYTQYLIEAVLIVYSIGVLIPNNEMTTVVLLMTLDYAGFMYDLVDYIASTKDHFVKSEFKSKRLLEILDNQNIDKFGKVNSLDNYQIVVNHLSYSYEDDKNKKVLKNISFRIKENTSNIFIGESGSGKSTLFGLLTKVLSTTDHRIFIGNKDINELSEATFRANVCIINQEPFLLNDTIFNNIKIVKPDATYEEIVNACKIANIYDEINMLENKFNTLIVENGNNLSGGQKQRISIARAILKNTKILLFDEPTSALDKNNQTMFFDMINYLKKTKTILIIAHKFDNLDSFDNVFELKDGKIRHEWVN